MGTAVLEDRAVEDVGGEISEAGWQTLCRMKWSGKWWEKGTPLCIMSRPRLEVTRTQGQRLIATHYSWQLLPTVNCCLYQVPCIYSQCSCYPEGGDWPLRPFPTGWGGPMTGKRGRYWRSFSLPHLGTALSGCFLCMNSSPQLPLMFSFPSHKTGLVTKPCRIRSDLPV